MSDRQSASGTVHWVGTGLSTGSGLRLLAERAASVTVWGRTEDKARACVERLGLAGDGVGARGLDGDALAGALRPGDVVVSMLPATEHPALLRMCLAARAHFACSSYVTPEITELAARAADSGLVVLTESGLDPGIDHLLAHDLVARARAVVGDDATASFTSYCGGVPSVPNEFRYRFSWAPRGVLTALRSPARYIEGGTEQVTPRPWERTRPLVVATAGGAENFEVYPNRDSLGFTAQYGIPPGWRLDAFVRGTLRLQGWHEAWRPVFGELSRDDGRITELARELAERYPTTDADRDRVVLSVALSAHGPGGRRYAGAHVLDMTGDERETAMARCVSTPVAVGVTEILTGAVPAGLRRAAEGPGEAGRWLDSLRAHGISGELHESSRQRGRAAA